MPAIILFYLLFLVISPAAAARKAPAKAAAPAPVEQNTEIFRTLEQSFQKTLGIENEKLKSLEERLAKTSEVRKELEAAHDKYRTMLSTQANLLLLPSVDHQTLVQANAQKKVVMDNIADQVGKLNERQEQLKGMRAETVEQITFYKDQITGLKAQSPHVTGNAILIKQVDSLMDVLAGKEKRIDELIGFNRDWADRFGVLKSELNVLSGKYEEIIARREKGRFLQQETSPVVRVMQGELAATARDAAGKTRFMLSGEFWSKPEEVTWENYGVFGFTFLLFFVVVEAILFVPTRYCDRMKTVCLGNSKFWQYLTLHLVERTLLIAGAIAFLHYYPIRPVYRLTPAYVFIPLIVRILSLFLAVQWGMAFIRSMQAIDTDRLFIRLSPLLRRLLIGIAIYGSGYFIIGRLYCEDCLFLVSWRLAFEIALLVWGVFFIRAFRRHASESKLSKYRWFENLRPVFVVIGYAAVLIGPLAEMTGFGGFAACWYLGLGQTALVLMWSIIFHGVLGELDVPSDPEEKEELEHGDETQPYPVRWLVIRLLRMALGFVAIFAVPIAWGAEQTFLADLFYAINYKIDIGNIQLSVMGVVYSVMVLLVVHTLAVIWRSALSKKILKDMRVDKGLKDSITRITEYGLWGIGILIALRVIGISGTSLTVVFGAISIGLGFGLQNIFNNFVSGIIILFERPIRVGDVIELDGIWGTVREINVRSTHVKTYDNADMIIPNSDFISQKLTNWSFHDARVRRKISIGVAYGSDTRLVKETLLKIASKHPKALKRPQPQVLFRDFGDSALIFELRVWCHIDHFADVETDLRFEIDNQFRELNIKIPFPTRDVYIQEVSAIPKNAGAREPDVGISGPVTLAGVEN